MRLKYIPTTALLFIAIIAAAQDAKPLKSFDKIVISPRINVVLTKGEQESIRIDSSNIPGHQINVKVKGGKLRIYLDHARITEKQAWVKRDGHSEKRYIYEGRSITVYVTYRELRSLEMRGEGSFRCDDEIRADKFRVKAYGETHIQLGKLTTQKFKASLYGENILNIKSGDTDRQVYGLFGENIIDAGGFNSMVTATRIYGEGKIKVTASDMVHINALGEPTIEIGGTSFITKGIVLGRAKIEVSR